MIAIKLNEKHFSDIIDYYTIKAINKLNLKQRHKHIEEFINKETYNELPDIIKQAYAKYPQHIKNTTLMIDAKDITNIGNNGGLNIVNYSSYEQYKKEQEKFIDKEENSKYNTTNRIILTEKEYNNAISINSRLPRKRKLYFPFSGSDYLDQLEIDKLNYFRINSYQDNAFPFNPNYKAKVFFKYVNNPDEIKYIQDYILDLLNVSDIQNDLYNIFIDNRDIINTSAELKLFFNDAYEYWYNMHKNEFPIETKVYNKDNPIPDRIAKIHQMINSTLETL